MDGEIDSHTLQNAVQNTAAFANVNIHQWDAQKLPFASDTVDMIVSNLPWGRQIAVNLHLRTLDQTIFAEMQRVIKPDGRIALLTTEAHFLPPGITQREISLFGQRPTISLYHKS